MLFYSVSMTPLAWGMSRGSVHFSRRMPPASILEMPLVTRLFIARFQEQTWEGAEDWKERLRRECPGTHSVGMDITRNGGEVKHHLYGDTTERA
jgi:hypothetical protein